MFRDLDLVAFSNHSDGGKVEMLQFDKTRRGEFDVTDGDRVVGLSAEKGGRRVMS